MKLWSSIILSLCLCASALARGGGGHSGGSHARSAPRSGSYHSSGVAHHTARFVQGAPRDGHGRIARSQEARHQFMRQTGYPHGRPGYVIDHIIPLKRGGKDDSSNMQWQTIADARAKDRVE